MPDHEARPIEWMAAADQLAALEAGDISSVELVELYLDRIATINPSINAVVSIDRERALDAARTADEQRAGGRKLGTLHGLPITVKDAYETAGLRTVCGQPGLASYVPEQDAEPVARLRKSGAIILGKTNMPTANADVQSSNPVFGRTNNPWDSSRTPGGSAGGGAAATASALTSFDYGSEIGGSTRLPAAYCGLFGHKVSYRSVPLIGHIPPGPGAGRWVEPDMACAGMQTRDARDLLLAVEATVGTHRRDGGFSYRLDRPRAKELKDFRVAVWTDDPTSPIDADVRAALDDVRATLADAGTRVVEHPATLPTDLATTHAIFQPLVFGAFSVDRSTISPRSAAGLVGRLIQHPTGDAAQTAKGTVQSHRSWLLTHAKREELRTRWTEFFEDYDVILMPATPTAAPPHHGKDHDRWGRTITVDGETRSYWEQVIWCAVANIAGSPATTIPVTRNRDGLPVGVQVMGPPAGDRTTIAFAELLAERLGGFQTPATLPTAASRQVNSVA